jgi:hypothetical protein
VKRAKRERNTSSSAIAASSENTSSCTGSDADSSTGTSTDFPGGLTSTTSVIPMNHALAATRHAAATNRGRVRRTPRSRPVTRDARHSASVSAMYAPNIAAIWPIPATPSTIAAAYSSTTQASVMIAARAGGAT